MGKIKQMQKPEGLPIKADCKKINKMSKEKQEAWVDSILINSPGCDVAIDPEGNYWIVKKTTKIEPSKELFNYTKKLFMKYIDTTELNYNLLTTWTLGTHFHNQFETYPLLQLNSRKQCGKTRTLKLISTLAFGSDGSISTSVTETFLFRHKEGSVFFDEMESISSREKTALRETINSVYKKGNKITRYIERKTINGKEYVEEHFYPFYPLGLANIHGFGDVLTDRSLQIILQRSYRPQTKLVEDFSTNPEIEKHKEKLQLLNINIPQGVFSEWNNFILTGKTELQFKNLFLKINKTKLTGRPLEIFLPLFLIAEEFGVLDILIKSSEEYMSILEGEELDNNDDLLQRFMDSSNYEGFTPSIRILNDFKNSLEEPEQYMNSKWFGRALKRLGLIKRKRWVNGKVQVELNNNTTNTTNPINTTNSTNTTKNHVEFVGFVDRKELVDKCRILEESQELQQHDNFINSLTNKPKDWMKGGIKQNDR